MKHSILLTISIFIISFSAMTLAQTEVKPLGITLDDYEYPYPVEYISLNIQGETFEMAYMDVQPENPNGQSVMLMHGKNFNGAYWGQTARDLSTAGFRVIIPDQIGFGKSSKPIDIQYSFHLLAKNTKTLLDAIGVEKTSVLGHSMGGMLATRFTLMHPEIVNKFILVNPIGLEDWKLKVPYEDVDQKYEQELGKSYESIKNYMQQSYYGGNWKPEYDEWVNVLAGWTKNPEYPVIARSSALTYDMIFTQPVVYEFPKIKADTLLIIGLRDKTALGKNLVSQEVRDTMGNYRELGRKTQRAIAGSQLVELDDVGHMPHIEAYDRFIDPLMAFLNE